MRLARAFSILSLTLVSSAAVQADIINGSYNLTSSNSSVNSAKSLPAIGTFNTGVAANFNGSPVDLSFVFNADTLTLSQTVYVGASPLNASFTWLFTALNLGADSITAVALTSSTDPGAVVNSFTGNSISITTPTGMLSGAPHQWTFSIQDTGSPPVAVPEPSSFAILMLGGAGFWFKRRRQVA